MIARVRFVLTTALLASIALARPALAGPPLLCHPFDIGTAASLPWSGTTSWFDGKTDYKVANLVADTEALLAPSTPVIVRMETLRRASIYASRDPKIAFALVERLTARAQASKATGRPDALALLDAAYATEALRQITTIGGIPGFKDQVDGVKDVISNADGWQYMKASLAARPDDPALEFAAALIAADKDRAAYTGHAQRARAGAAKDALLARNLSHIS
ncbi:MAG: hypothetical protein DMF84_24265 [Acidobacteria bacterium]|nr:MAG: hypothetical protein DMF84_24265 [Acidobacteriota bacterium]